MVRHECYQCARCGKPWSVYYPRVVCPCGCDVLRRRQSGALVDRYTAAMAVAVGVMSDWSPYRQGNGQEGVCHG